MENSVDIDARDRVAKLWTEFRELAVDYWGANKDNGKRSSVEAMEKRLRMLEIKVKHYEDTKVSSCLGLAAVEDLKSLAKQEEQTLKIERERSKTMMMVQWVQVFGIIAVAVIALLKP